VPNAEFRCAVIALVGPPNSGKSTLLNALVGEKVSIVAPKPQTTRLNVRGIVNRPGVQLVFIDSPGLLTPKNHLEESMRSGSAQALKDADIVLVIASADTEEDLHLSEGIEFSPGKSILVVNKTDAHKKDRVLQVAVALLERLKLDEVVNISAKSGQGLEELVALLSARAPLGAALYPEDDLSDMNLRVSAAEIIREKALLLTREEVPHSLAVIIEKYTEREDGLHEVTATLYVERETQKGIVIGAKGALLKEIGSAARKDLEKLADAKVFLTLWVKVAKDWKKDRAFIKNMGLPLGKERP
jgi:GTP-binding protein Era